MTTEELKKILNETLEKTQQRSVKWKPAKDGILRLDFPRSTLEIAKLFSSAQGTWYELRVYNSTGSCIVTIREGSLGNTAETKQKLAAIYAGAYEIAFETRETLGDILKGLGG